MRRVFLGLFCLSFVSSMAWGSPHPLFKRGSKPKLKIEDLGLSFQKIYAGSFTMGSPRDEGGRNLRKNEIQVEVTITKDFQMQTTEVTQKQYFLVTGKKPSYFKSPEYCKNYDEVNEICPDHPVEQVSWHDAKKFIKFLNFYAGVRDCEGTPKDPRGCYRLPTEAEFEWAARAGTKTAYFFGNDTTQLGFYAVYRKNLRRRTHQVTFGTKNPNNLNGIIGNVWEWTEDHYNPKLVGGRDPLNTKKRRRAFHPVIRGGGWNSHPSDLRSATRARLRDQLNPHSNNEVGFRLVRTL